MALPTSNKSPRAGLARQRAHAYKTFSFTSPAAMRAWGKRFAKFLKPGDTLALVGTLGAGKTTLTQGISLGWGYEGETTSPTFALVNEYTSDRGALYHMDLYRLSPKELISFPFEDYLSEGACILEWGDRLQSRWPKETLQFQLFTQGPQTRRLEIVSPSPQWKKRLSGL